MSNAAMTNAAMTSHDERNDSLVALTALDAYATFMRADACLADVDLLHE